jgi:hypothetical protein
MYFQVKNTLNYHHSFKIKKNIPFEKLVIIMSAEIEAF